MRIEEDETQRTIGRKFDEKGDECGFKDGRHRSNRRYPSIP
jgi:hypothetical protein